MLIPIIVEYKYNNNSIEVNLKHKKDYFLKYIYIYDLDNLICNCRIYKYKSDGSCNNIIFVRDNNTTKVFMNYLLADEISKNNNEYIIKSYDGKEDEPSNIQTIVFFNDQVDKYRYANGDKKCELRVYCTNYFDKNNRLIKSAYNNKYEYNNKYDDKNRIAKKSKILYEYDDKNRIIKKIIKIYEKDINYMNITTKTFKYDEDNNRCICNTNSKYNNINIENETIDDLEIYVPNMIEHRDFNTLESQQFLVKYGEFFLRYANYLVLNPDNKDIGINFKYDNQSRVISKEIQLSDLDMDML